jgi:hypothetical protein
MVYMTRRVVAFQIILYLLAAYLVAPAAPMLVCRMTGQPMRPVVATPATRHSCCAVAVTAGADGTRYALSSPGCCDLRFTARGEAPVAANPAAPDPPAAPGWAPAPPAIHVPLTGLIAVSPAAQRQDAPRAPPSRPASPRAPPTHS